jgi:hypothetical protein
VALICEECAKPIHPADLPVVIEWGKKETKIAELGLPIKRAVHLHCNASYTAKHPLQKKRKDK